MRRVPLNGFGHVGAKAVCQTAQVPKHGWANAADSAMHVSTRGSLLPKWRSPDDLGADGLDSAI